jgi:hypothetical protein
MKKEIYIQTQGVKANYISNAKPFGFVAINCDNVKLTIDAYHGTGPTADPREDSLVTIIDDNHCYELTPELLLEAVRFFHEYSTLGNDVAKFKNVLHVVMPDRYKNGLKRDRIGLKI